MLQIKDLSNFILRDINFEVKKWEIFIIMGHNGSWKTTLLKTIIWLEKVDKGIILFEWKDITKFSVYERAKLWIGYIFQEVPEYDGIRVEKYIFDILQKNDITLDKNKIEKMFEDFGLDWYIYKDRYFDHRLSWWEKKKIEIILTFLLDRKLYLFDEVENSLDATSRKVLLNYISEQKKIWKSFIIVSHNEDFIKFADKAILLCDWKIIQEWKPNQILSKYVDRCLECKVRNDA